MNASLPEDGTVAKPLPDDPTIDTPMVVTLDQLRAYDLNPRVTRNPLYDDIKASIRARGLDAPPAITRRPGEEAYLIRNGGNTRLAILHELWTETGQERFFRITCLFRPWPERGEIIALTGHLAENELHGSLTFIERALAVEKARELYEQESGHALSQSELARCLAVDGYPVPQSHISRMQETVRHLLPAMPSLLHSGLGRPQIEKLLALRKLGQFIWEQHVADTSVSDDFPVLFHAILSDFDAAVDTFSIERVQDELIGRMAEQLGIDYDVLAIELDQAHPHQASLNASPLIAWLPKPRQEVRVSTSPALPQSTASRHEIDPLNARAETPVSAEVSAQGKTSVARAQDHNVSPTLTTPRLQAIRQHIAQHTDAVLPDVDENVPHAIPLQTDGLYPITDVWFVEVSLHEPASLRTHIAQFAREIAAEVNAAEQVQPLDDDMGYHCLQDGKQETPQAKAVLDLLDALARDSMSALLCGRPSTTQPFTRLSDASLIKLFRLIRLARVLFDLELHHSYLDH